MDSCGKRRGSWVVAVLGLVVLACSGVVMACPINGLGGGAEGDPELVPGTGWQQFDWGSGTPAPTTPGPWTCTLAETCILDVTDCFVAGDEFAVYDFGTLLGATAPVPDTSDWTDDIDFAFADPRWSSGSFDLGPGSHSISISVSDNPYNYGSAYLRLRTAGEVIPEPTTLSLLALGVLGAVRARRRSRA